MASYTITITRYHIYYLNLCHLSPNIKISTSPSTSESCVQKCSKVRNLPDGLQIGFLTTKPKWSGK